MAHSESNGHVADDVMCSRSWPQYA